MDEYGGSQVAHGSGPDAVDALEPLFDARGWMRFLAWVSIVGGVLQCLTIIGLVYGWVPIWIGVLLLRTAEGVEQGTHSRDGNRLREGMTALATAVRVQAILVALGVLLSGAYILILVIGLAIGAMN